MKKVLFFAIFFYFMALLQSSFLIHFSWLGAVPNLILVSVILFSFLEKPNEKFSYLGAVIGGAFLDIFSNFPLGFNIIILLFLVLLIKKAGNILKEKNVGWFCAFFGLSTTIYLLLLNIFGYSLGVLLIEIIYNFAFGIAGFCLLKYVPYLKKNKKDDASSKDYGWVRRFGKEVEPQEIFLDHLAQRKEKELGFSKKKIEVPLSNRAFQILGFAFLVLLLVLFGKTLQLQVIEAQTFSRLAEENKFTIHSIKAERGVIYDKDLNQLVFNQLSFTLVCDKRLLPLDEAEKGRIFQEISHIIGIDAEELKRMADETKQPIFSVAENLGHRDLIVLETRMQEFIGFKIDNNTIRNYPEGESFAHLIGYTGKIKTAELGTFSDYSLTDYVGRDGLERAYERNLRKKPGKLRVERDTFGNPMSNTVVALPESGDSLVLWLDSGLQKKLETAIGDALIRVGATRAAAVALDPKTGGVLALVSLPSFDNNLFAKGISQEEWNELINDPAEPFLNRVIAGQYPTGSTIKPLIASAALEEKIISPTKPILCQGKIEIPNPWHPEIVYTFHDWRTHNWTDVRKAIAESCNVFFYTIGGGYGTIKGLGAEKIKEYLTFFGWGEKTGINLPGEMAGFIPDKEWKKEYFENPTDKIWMPGDTYNLSIGQGYLSMTPLQVAVSFAAIANKGKLLKPQMVKEIINVEKIEPEVIRENFISSENIQIVREGMRQAVTGRDSPYASATLLNSLPVSVAAKTGTAQTSREGFYHNWLSVFAPYDDPQIVLTVMVENVKGEQVAVKPIVQEVLDWYFQEQI